jgi:hypothetical protein
MLGLPALTVTGIPAGIATDFAKLSGFCQMPLVGMVFKKCLVYLPLSLLPVLQAVVNFHARINIAKKP